MDPTKPGWKTSEFWLPILMAGLIGLLTKFLAVLVAAGFPVFVAAALGVVVPVVLGWLTSKYGDNRNALKLGAQATQLQAAALKAAPPPASAAQAVAILNAPPGG